MKHKGSSTSRKKKSLCEKSMILVANIIKLSSLSLGNINLGTTRIKIQQPPEPAASGAKVTKVDVPGHQTHHSSRSQPKRSQEPENESKPSSIVMQVPSTNQNTSTTTAATAASTSTQSSYVSEKSKRDAGGDVNQRAADFIEKMRDKIQKNQDDQLVVNLTPGTTTAGIVSSKHTSRALPAPAPKISKQHYYS
ncbi:hypothetical protein FF1_011570 [Malus domestica]